MRRLVNDDDLTKITSIQNRLGKDVKITAFTSVVKCGFLHNYRFLEPQFSNILYFDGYLTTNDGGQGYYAKTEDTHEDDIGIYITIAGTKYKRIFTGPVKLEWFSIDAAAALTKAIKYGNIELDYNKVYYLYRPLSLTIENNVAINMNASTFNYIGKCNVLLTIDAPGIDYFTLQRGTINARKCGKAIRFINRPKYIDCNTLMTYKPATLAIPSPKLLTNKTPSIAGIKTFTKPIISVDPVNAEDLVTNKYLVDKSVAANIATIDKDDTIESATFTGSTYLEETTSLDIDDDRVVTKDILPVVAQHIFDTRIKPKLSTEIVCPIAIGGTYMQFSKFMHNFEPFALPIIAWPNSCWKQIYFRDGASVAIGSTVAEQKLVYVSNQGTSKSDSFYARLYKRAEPFISKELIDRVQITRNGNIEGTDIRVYEYKEDAAGAYNTLTFNLEIPSELSSYRYSVSAIKLNQDYDSELNFSNNGKTLYLSAHPGFYSVAFVVIFSNSEGEQQGMAIRFTLTVLPGCSINGNLSNLTQCFILKNPGLWDVTRYQNGTNTTQRFIIWNRYYTDMQTHITPRADTGLRPPNVGNWCAFLRVRVITTALYYRVNYGEWNIVRVNTAPGKVKKRNNPSHNWPHVDFDSTYWSVSSRTDGACDTNSVWSTIPDRLESTEIELPPGSWVEFAYFAFSQYVGQPYPPSQQYEVNGEDIKHANAPFTDTDFNIDGGVIKLGQCYMPDKNAPFYLIFK